MITYQASPRPPAVPASRAPAATPSRRWCSPRQPWSSFSMSRTVTPGLTSAPATWSGRRTTGLSALMSR